LSTSPNAQHEMHLRRAIELGRESMMAGNGGPFGAVVVKAGKVVAEATNFVLKSNDPTAHAEVQAIRKACQVLGHFQLEGCTIYSSCEPCPMCLGAIYWARPDALYFAAGRQDAAKAGFDDALIYDELPLPANQRRMPTQQLLQSEATEPFEQWTSMANKKPY
jgi:guanine deaminase